MSRLASSAKEILDMASAETFGVSVTPASWARRQGSRLGEVSTYDRSRRKAVISDRDGRRRSWKIRTLEIEHWPPKRVGPSLITE